VPDDVTSCNDPAGGGISSIYGKVHAELGDGCAKCYLQRAATRWGYAGVD
jgi:hypothetical protein